MLEDKHENMELFQNSRQDNDTLTRSELSAIVYKKVPRLSREESRRLVSQVFEEICLGLLDDQKVKLHGFGIFRVLNKNARPGRNPKTKEDVVITARRVISFIPGPRLRKAVEAQRVNFKAWEDGEIEVTDSGSQS